MRTIVITGSTKGIGKAIGIKFLKEGYYVIFNYAKDDEACQLLKEEIAIYNGSYEVIIASDINNVCLQFPQFMIR